MTDRFNYLTVALEKDTRDDDAEQILNAIRMIKGVASVKGNVKSQGDWMAEQRIRIEVRDRLFDIIENPTGKSDI